jgi:uncharacterized protein
MNKRSIFSALLALGAVLFLAAAPVARAASPAIEAAKSQGLVGEQADGYLGVVSGKSISADLQREVDANNIQRKTYYTEVAAKNGTTVEQAGIATALKLVATKVASGEYYQDGSGAWKKK